MGQHYISCIPRLDGFPQRPGFGAEGPVVTFKEANMTASFPRHTSRTTEALWRVLSWPARVAAARRTLTELARMSEYELRDIGLSRQDLNDTTSLPLDADPSGLLVRRRASRERHAAGRADLAA